MEVCNLKVSDYEKAETSNIDYKVSLEVNKPKSWLKSVSAFANTKGGIILFGVDDKTHELKGLNDIQEASEKITEIINSKILPLPRYEINTFIEEKAITGTKGTTKEKNKLTVLEIVIEFYARGFHFLPIDLYKSDAKRFIIEGNALIPPFNSLQGLGDTAAQGIVEGRENGGEFKTIEEFKQRTSVGKTLVELLKENGVLKGIPETNQLSLFSLS